MSELVQIARMIGPYLMDLVGAEVASWDESLGALLEAHAAGEDVDDRLTNLFATSPAVLAWVAATLDDPGLLPPEVSSRAERYEPLAGDRVGSRLQRYECPRGGDTVWYRTSPSEIVPVCRRHDEVLVLVSGR